MARKEGCGGEGVYIVFSDPRQAFLLPSPTAPLTLVRFSFRRLFLVIIIIHMHIPTYATRKSLKSTLHRYRTSQTMMPLLVVPAILGCTTEARQLISILYLGILISTPAKAVITYSTLKLTIHKQRNWCT